MTASDGAKPMKRQCTGTVIKTGKRCTLPPIIGGTVCHKHGGSAPQVRAAARRRVSEAEALKVLAAMDVPPMTDPLTALERLAGLAVALVDVALGQLAKLDSMVGPDHQGDERAKVHVQLLGQFMDRAQKFAADLARLNLDERIAGMHALVLVRQSELMAGLVRAILAELRLTPEQQVLVGVVVPAKFRELEQRSAESKG